MEKVTLESATKWCLAHAADGCEHAMVFAPDGTLRFTKHGDSEHVDFYNESVAGKIHPGDILVHNHPSPHHNSLSSGDIMFANMHQVVIHAVTSDGGRYTADCRLQKVPREFLGYAASTCLQNADWEINPYLKEISQDEYSMVRSHKMNVRLDDRSLIRYEYTLGSAMIEALRKVKNAS